MVTIHNLLLLLPILLRLNDLLINAFDALCLLLYMHPLYIGVVAPIIHDHATRLHILSVRHDVSVGLHVVLIELVSVFPLSRLHLLSFLSLKEPVIVLVLIPPLHNPLLLSKLRRVVTSRHLGWHL